MDWYREMRLSSQTIDTDPSLSRAYKLTAALRSYVSCRAFVIERSSCSKVRSLISGSIEASFDNLCLSVMVLGCWSSH